MLETFLQKEAVHKAAAERAARSGDWAGLLGEAEELVTVYGAIMASGMAAPESMRRWSDLREKWQGIARQAKAKCSSENAKKTEKRAVPANGPDEPGKPADKGGEKVEPKATPQPDNVLKLDDVKGLAEAKQVVMDALVNPVKHPDVYKTLKIKSGKGLLLYGPPGTGKTMFARAIAGEMGLPFIYKKISELKDKYVGESEKSVARLFEEAYSHRQSVVFLDECEGLLRRRGHLPWPCRHLRLIPLRRPGTGGTTPSIRGG